MWFYCQKDLLFRAFCLYLFKYAKKTSIGFEDDNLGKPKQRFMKAVSSLLTLNDVMLMVLQGLLYNAALWWSLTATIFLDLCQHASLIVQICSAVFLFFFLLPKTFLCFCQEQNYTRCLYPMQGTFYNI